MRKWTVSICAVAMVLGILATPAFARPYGRQNPAPCVGRRTCSLWLDTDADGICDNRTAEGKGTGNLTDADNDGICDNRSENRSSARGSWRGGQGKGCRRNR